VKSQDGKRRDKPNPRRKIAERQVKLPQAKKSKMNEPATPRGKRTRERILRAAERLFGERGYERTSVVQITEKARTAQSTFYIYFRSKKAVLDELVRELNYSLRRELARAIDGVSNRKEADQAAFHAFFSFILKRRNLYRIMNQVEFVDERLYRWCYRKLADGYLHEVAKAIDKGEYRRMNPELMAFSVLGIAAAVGMRWVIWEGKMPPAEILENSVRLMHHGLAVPEVRNSRSSRTKSSVQQT
jgi:AcrR family transcriptional regulator